MYTLHSRLEATREALYVIPYVSIHSDHDAHACESNEIMFMSLHELSHHVVVSRTLSHTLCCPVHTYLTMTSIASNNVHAIRYCDRGRGASNQHAGKNKTPNFAKLGFHVPCSVWGYDKASTFKNIKELFVVCFVLHLEINTRTLELHASRAQLQRRASAYRITCKHDQN